MKRRIDRASYSYFLNKDLFTIQLRHHHHHCQGLNDFTSIVHCHGVPTPHPREEGRQFQELK